MDIRVDLRGEACLLLAALCLILPLDWLLAAGLAAAFHEVCHILATVLLGGSIRRLTIGPSGAVLETSSMSPLRQLVAVLAGPVGSLFLMHFSEMQPIVAICGLTQGLFNLLPVYPLDGGRGLELLTGMLFTPSVSRLICEGAFYLTMTAILAAGLYGSFLAGLGTAPVMLSLLLVSAAVKAKISCKEGNERVQ